MSRILSHRAVSGALFALAAVVATNSFAGIDEAAANQKSGKPNHILVQKDKPSVPDHKIPGRDQRGAAGEPGPAESFYKWCYLSGGGASTDENGGWVCTKPDGSTIP